MSVGNTSKNIVDMKRYGSWLAVFLQMNFFLTDEWLEKHGSCHLPICGSTPAGLSIRSTEHAWPNSVLLRIIYIIQGEKKVMHCGQFEHCWKYIYIFSEKFVTDLENQQPVFLYIQ
jgi:hypothetical protein